MLKELKKGEFFKLLQGHEKFKQCLFLKINNDIPSCDCYNFDYNILYRLNYMDEIEKINIKLGANNV